MRTVLNNEDHPTGLEEEGGGLGREQSSPLKGILLGEYHPPKCSRKLDNNAMKFVKGGVRMVKWQMVMHLSLEAENYTQSGRGVDCPGGGRKTIGD